MSDPADRPQKMRRGQAVRGAPACPLDPIFFSPGRAAGASPTSPSCAYGPLGVDDVSVDGFVWVLVEPDPEELLPVPEELLPEPEVPVPDEPPLVSLLLELVERSLQPAPASARAQPRTSSLRDDFEFMGLIVLDCVVPTPADIAPASGRGRQHYALGIFPLSVASQAITPGKSRTTHSGRPRGIPSATCGPCGGPPFLRSR